MARGRVTPPTYEGLSLKEQVQNILNYIYEKDEAEGVADLERRIAALESKVGV